jgi:hypothetical protein
MFEVVFLCALLDGVTPENYGKIEFGMTKQEVIEILGMPPVVNVTADDRLSFFYTVNSSEIMQNGDLWRLGTQRIWVLFDKNNTVRGKMWEGPSTPIPLPQERIRALGRRSAQLGLWPWRWQRSGMPISDTRLDAKEMPEPLKEGIDG